MLTDSQRQRRQCHRYLVRAARRRGIAFERGELVRLESRIDHSRAAFERPGVDRYLVRIRRGRQRLTFLYVARLGCLLTVWERKGTVDGH